jgi:hypothetical protein
MDYSEAYGSNSIMHYLTRETPDPNSDLHGWLISKWRDGSKDFQPPNYDPVAPEIAPIFNNYDDGPTSMGVEAIKRIYPW